MIEVVVLFVVLFLIMRKYLTVTTELKRITAMRRFNLAQELSVLTRNLLEIRSYNKMQFFDKRFHRLSNRYQNCFTHEVSYSQRWLMIRIEIIGGFIIGFIIILGSANVYINSSNGNDKDVYFFLSLSATWGLTILDLLWNAVFNFSKFETSISSVERIYQYIKYNPTDNYKGREEKEL